MSHRAMSETWERADIHDPLELLVLLAIADLSDDKGHAACSAAVLTKRCRMSEASVRKVVARLKLAGVLGSQIKANIRDSGAGSVPEEGS